MRCNVVVLTVVVLLVQCTRARKIILKDPIVGSVLSKRCKLDRDCIENAYCEVNNECYCKLNHVPVPFKNILRCLKEALNHGDSCYHHLQCTAAFGTTAECRFNSSDSLPPEGVPLGQCLCQQHAHFHDGKCHKTSYIGEKCLSTENCKILSTSVNPFCEDSVCVCPPNFKPNADNNDCLPAAGLLESCVADTHCKVPNSVCFGTCQCKVGYVRVSGDRCLQAVDELEWQCEDSKQCSEYLRQTACDPERKRCVCEHGSHPIKGACYYNADLGDACSHPYECLKSDVNISSSNVQCHQGICKCAPHLVESNKKCVPGEGTTLRPLLTLFVFLLCILLVN